MTVEPIGTTAAAVYITPDELKTWGLTPETVTARAAAELARKALARVGMQAEGTIEIEAYQDPLGVLLFARICPGEEGWFSFEGLEELLQGVGSLSRPRPEGKLALWEGRYWLHVAGGQGICRLAEFGRGENPPPHFAARLEEYGAVLLPADALRELERYFGV